MTLRDLLQFAADFTPYSQTKRVYARLLWRDENGVVIKAEKKPIGVSYGSMGRINIEMTGNYSPEDLTAEN